MRKDALLQLPSKLQFALQPLLLHQSSLGFLQFTIGPGKFLVFALQVSDHLLVRLAQPGAEYLDDPIE